MSIMTVLYIMLVHVTFTVIAETLHTEKLETRYLKVDTLMTTDILCNYSYNQQYTRLPGVGSHKSPWLKVLASQSETVMFLRVISLCLLLGVLYSSECPLPLS